ncbi:MAG: 5-carboxymethyl-2-hydroxymuconate isomerase [Gammaproteobacteria bacterium]|nr:5-carboxymethyl-2-hydroxymuconate isomerase [Gammaproteobacteria bacterium]
MPHFILEYSANLDDDLDLDGLFGALHETAMDTGVFALGGVRFRAHRSAHYLVPAGDPDNAVVQRTARIGRRRDPDVRREVGEKIFNTLTEYLDSLYRERPLAISFEMTELTFGLSFRKNNIHERIKRKQGADQAQ